MERDKLVRALLNASELEESNIPVITSFFLENFDWIGIDEEKVERAKEILKKIRSDTMEHERILNDLVGIIRRAVEDEF